MDNNQPQKRVKVFAFNGVLAALAVVVLFLASSLPTSRLALYSLGSFFTAVIIIEFGVKTSLLFYITASLITFIVIPNKIGIIPYIVFFGIYGIVKFYIEKLNKLLIEFVIKLAFFNMVLAIGILVAREFLFESISLNLPWVVFIAGFEVIFIVYDYVYSLFIQYYNTKIRKHIKL